MGNFKINKAAMRDLERQIQAKTPGVKVPLGGSDADAAKSVSRQLKAMGAVPDDKAVAQMVRDARAKAEKS